MSSGPAKILGAAGHAGRIAPGDPANLVVFDAEATWTVDPSSMASRSRNTPFAGRKLRGRVVHTMLRGRFTVKEGEPIR
jgi:dihydroorotase